MYIPPVADLYAVVGYAFVPEIFIAEDYPDPDIEMCGSVFICWLSALTNGLRDGDIGKIMEPTGSQDPRYPFLVAYQFSYYLIVILVLLNCIFGLIIDTFGELRTLEVNDSPLVRCLDGMRASTHPECPFTYPSVE